jgi:hypothetical protein
MSNKLNIDLKDKYVVLSKEYMKPEYHEVKSRVFLCQAGNGCRSFTIGQGIFGKFVFDGEECRVEGFEVERLATEEEIKEASKN